MPVFSAKVRFHRNEVQQDSECLDPEDTGQGPIAGLAS